MYVRQGVRAFEFSLVREDRLRVIVAICLFKVGSVLIRPIFSSLLIFALFASAAPVSAQIPPVGDREVQIQAASLYYLAQFTDWPAIEHTASSQLGGDQNALKRRIRFCFIESDELADAFQNLTQGRRIGDLDIESFTLEPSSIILKGSSCHLLFLNTDSNRIISSVEHLINNFAVLIVTPLEALFPDIATVLLYKQGNRMRIKVNMNAAGRMNLQLSSELLALSELVYPPPIASAGNTTGIPGS